MWQIRRNWLSVFLNSRKTSSIGRPNLTGCSAHAPQESRGLRATFSWDNDVIRRLDGRSESVATVSFYLHWSNCRRRTYIRNPSKLHNTSNAGGRLRARRLYFEHRHLLFHWKMVSDFIHYCRASLQYFRQQSQFLVHFLISAILNKLKRCSNTTVCLSIMLIWRQWMKMSSFNERIRRRHSWVTNYQKRINNQIG